MNTRIIILFAIVTVAAALIQLFNRYSPKPIQKDAVEEKLNRLDKRFWELDHFMDTAYAQSHAWNRCYEKYHDIRYKYLSDLYWSRWDSLHEIRVKVYDTILKLRPHPYVKPKEPDVMICDTVPLPVDSLYTLKIKYGTY